ncbi:MAG TPA: MFS transporter [Gaiellaceae bacterium]|jgi:fucose permease|nr:MFS transporter [Gaiellaceae bacterium]
MTAPSRLERDELTRLAYLMLGLWGFLLYALGPALPALREQLGVSRAVVSLHTTLIAAGAVAVGLVGHRFVLALGRRRAFWVAATGVALGALGLALGGRIEITLPVAAVFGFAGALLVAIIQAALADRHGTLGPAAIVESNALAAALGAAAPLAVALAIVAGSDWRAVFVAAALLAVPALALAYRSVCFPAAPELPHGHEPELPRAYWLYWSALLFFVAIEFCVVFWSADYLETERNLSNSSAAAAVSLFLVGIALGRFAGGWLVKRIAPERLLVAALVLAASGFLVFWLVPLAAAAVMALFVTGAGVAVLYPLGLALAIRAAGGRTDAASARAAFAAGIAIAVAPFVLGALADAANLRAAYAIVPALIATGLVTLGIARRAEAATRRAGSSPSRGPEPGDVVRVPPSAGA